MADNQRRKLLFCSYYSYLDHSSGAALATRDLLELLTQRGWECAVFSGPLLDDRTRSIEDAMGLEKLPFQFRRAPAFGFPCTLYHAEMDEVHYHGFVPTSYGPLGDPNKAEGQAFLHLFDSVLQRFRPDIVVTYGGQWVVSGIIQSTNQIGAKSVFALHNMEYTKKEIFSDVAAIFVPSHAGQRHYERTLGLKTVVLPGPWNWNRILGPAVDGRFVTFVNPQPNKGAFWVARIAYEMAQRRPDIPFLIVDSRGKAEWLSKAELDVSRITNLHKMLNTHDPRQFYGISRMVLVPSLWQEMHSRVGVEATINGIPVLASNRGGMPEVLAEAGFLFDIPERFTAFSSTTPTAEEVRPWIEMIERLWDDSAFFEQERERSRSAAEAWKPEPAYVAFERFFTNVLNGLA